MRADAFVRDYVDGPREAKEKKKAKIRAELAGEQPSPSPEEKEEDDDDDSEEEEEEEDDSELGYYCNNCCRDDELIVDDSTLLKFALGKQGTSKSQLREEYCREELIKEIKREDQKAAVEAKQSVSSAAAAVDAKVGDKRPRAE